MSQWYPVYVNKESSNLQVVKSKYCRDAILKYRKNVGKTQVQVASFTSYSKAKRFADILENRFAHVEIGEPTWR